MRDTFYIIAVYIACTFGNRIATPYCFHRHFSIPVNPTRGIRARVRWVGIAVAVYRLAVLIDDGRPRRGVDGNGFVDGGLGMDGQVEDGGAAVRGFGVETAAKCGQREGVK